MSLLSAFSKPLLTLARRDLARTASSTAPTCSSAQHAHEQRPSRLFTSRSSRSRSPWRQYFDRQLAATFTSIAAAPCTFIRYDRHLERASLSDGDEEGQGAGGDDRGTHDAVARP